jgi:hypothetical protein
VKNKLISAISKPQKKIIAIITTIAKRAPLELQFVLPQPGHVDAKSLDKYYRPQEQFTVS